MSIADKKQQIGQDLCVGCSDVVEDKQAERKGLPLALLRR